MAAPDRTILCGGAAPPGGIDEDQIVRLDLGGDDPNVTLEIAGLSRRLSANIPDVLADLAEIATYVYSADQAVTRGGEGTLDFGKHWRRQLIFHIPVRCPDVWSSPAIAGSLRDTLSFLSDDEKYEFNFTYQRTAHPIQQYLTLAGTDSGTQDFEEVVPFSGGLDSLGGAVQEAVICKRRIALVGHRSNAKTDCHQRQLVANLRSFCADNPPLFVPVWVHKDKALTREATQRSRSFLYASLALIVARALGHKRVRFYENGVVGLNLPISEQAVGARATRTTHPQVLNGFAKLFSLLVEDAFSVENPFLWRTKAEVVDLIGDAGCGDLIQYSVSCMHTYEQTTEHPHCGRCSQCISRRFATLASKYSHCDPGSQYKVDLLLGERLPDVDLTLVESCIRKATTIQSMTDGQMVEQYGEIGRVLRHVSPLTADQVAEQVIRLYKRHSDEVCGVMDAAMAAHAADIREGKLPATCAVILAVSDAYKSAASGLASRSADAGQGESHPPVAVAVPISQNLFHLEQDVWTVAFDGKTAHVPDLTGIGYIAELLRHPRTQIEAAALVMPVHQGSNGGTDAGHVRMTRAIASMPGIPMADAKAIKAVRKELAAREAELASGSDADSPSRRKLQDEISKLQDYLSQVGGRSGKARITAGLVQRARSSAKHAIDRAIRSIAAQHPSLGCHLKAAIQTGTSIVYMPTEVPDWRF